MDIRGKFGDCPLGALMADVYNFIVNKNYHNLHLHIGLAISQVNLPWPSPPTLVGKRHE